MTKQEAIALFGTRPIDLARAMGLTKQAINSWSDPLTPHQVDRVQAHLYRLQLATKRATPAVATVEVATQAGA